MGNPHDDPGIIILVNGWQLQLLAQGADKNHGLGEPLEREVLIDSVMDRLV